MWVWNLVCSMVLMMVGVWVFARVVEMGALLDDTRD
jgi:hypothetical protein